MVCFKQYWPLFSEFREEVDICYDKGRLLANGIHHSPDRFPHKGRVMRSVYVDFIDSLNKLLNKLSNCPVFETS